MKIGILLLGWGIGGTERRFPNLLRYLVKHSSNRYFLIINRYLANLLKNTNHLEGLDDIIYEIPLKDTLVTRLADSPKNLFNKDKFHIPGPNYIIWRFKKFIKNKCYTTKKFSWVNDLDVVHITGPYWSTIFPKEIPKVVEGQDSSLKYFDLSIIKNMIYDKAIINFASNRIKDNFCKKFKYLNNNNLFVNPCSFIDYSNTRIIKKEKLVIFCGSGNLKKIKNPFLFASAAHRVLTKINDVKFIVMGTGHLEHQLRSFISKMGMDKFFQVGFDPNPVNTFARSLIFVSLQEYDNYHSQSLMEAMACGCAIVASDVGETWRLVSKDIGYRVQLKPESIAERIEYLLDNPNQAIMMGKKAREKVMQEQTVEKYAEYIENVYKIVYEKAKQNK